jgi:branched-chain amino acid transport system permease protein
VTLAARAYAVVTPGRVLLAAVIGFLLAWPYLGATRFMLHIGSLFFIYVVVASYWNLLNGYAGILSLGNMGFFALGAYLSAVMARELGISPWITIALGGAITALIVTVLLGLPVLRLRGIYIALVTLVFADALPSVISLLREWTGGGVGLLGIPTLLAGIEKWQAYYLTLGFAIVALIVLWWIVHGRLGKAFVALRDSEEFAIALGIDRFREGLKVFAISAFVTGMAGGMFAHTFGQISPGMLGVEQFLLVIAMFLLGGAGTFFGPIIGAAIITFGNEYLRIAGSVRLGLLGGLIVVTMLFFPGGIMQLLDSTWSAGERLRRRDAPDAGPTEEPEEPAPAEGFDREPVEKVYPREQPPG